MLTQTDKSNQHSHGKGGLGKFLSENLPLLLILVGITLVSLSIGPYQNGDTQWEYEAASGILRWGMPYVNNIGNLMNQPPVGFYIEALFFRIFGASISNGTILMTLFGLGCVALVYKIGEAVYGKATGLFAAVLFALTPWHFILSRSFLIDVQSLFFSLLTLLIGITAIRKDSLKLLVISGAVFAAAFLTKFFAIYTLIPLLLFYIYSRPKNRKLTFRWLIAFFLPVLLISLLWYQIISGQGISSLFGHGDFTSSNPTGLNPSFMFIENFLVNYGVGWFFIDAAIISLIVLPMQTKLFRRFIFFDVASLATIVAVLTVNGFLGVVLDLKSPYLNAIKYDYQALPFFSLVAASLVGKSLSLFASTKSTVKLKRTSFIAISAGLFLVAAAIFYNMYYVHSMSTWDYLLFRVEPQVNFGYSLFDPAPIGEYSLLMGIQFIGFALVLSGLVWASRHKLKSILHYLSKR